MKSKQKLLNAMPSDGAELDWQDALCIRELTCELQDSSDKIWSAHAWAKHAQPLTLFDALHIASGPQRLEVWQAIEHLARGLFGHQRTNLSLQRSRLLLTNGVLQGAMLITADAIPRVDDSRGLIELRPEDFADWLDPSTPMAKLEHWLQPVGLYKNAQVRVPYEAC
jgi:hypothetical protein